MTRGPLTTPRTRPKVDPVGDSYGVGLVLFRFKSRIVEIVGVAS